MSREDARKFAGELITGADRQPAALADFELIARAFYPLHFPLWFRVLIRPWRRRFLDWTAARALEEYEKDHGTGSGS